MRVLSGRLKAVLVATLATIVLVGVLAPATTLASNPPGLARFMYAMGQVESGGNYTARNAYDRRVRQVPDHAVELAVVGAPLPRQLQRAADPRQPGDRRGRQVPQPVPRARELAPRRLLVADRIEPDHGLVDLRDELRQQGHDHLPRRPRRAARPRPAPARRQHRPRSVHRYSETSSKITYSGTWRIGRLRGYAGGAAKYSTKAGATASFAFSGSKVVWYGPVGPTRGKARVLVDGTY